MFAMSPEWYQDLLDEHPKPVYKIVGSDLMHNCLVYTKPTTNKSFNNLK